MDEVFALNSDVIADLIETDFDVAVNICRWTTKFADIDFTWPSSSSFMWDKNRIDHLNREEYNARLVRTMRQDTEPQRLEAQYRSLSTGPEQSSSSSSKQKASDDAPGTPPPKNSKPQMTQ